MKPLLFSLAPLLLLCSCEALPIQARNACLPDALRVRDAMPSDRWANILIVHRTQPPNHAYCVFEYRGLRAYDCQRGTRRLQTTCKDPARIAAELEPGSLGGKFLE